MYFVATKTTTTTPRMEPRKCVRITDLAQDATYHGDDKGASSKYKSEEAATPKDYEKSRCATITHAGS